MPNLEQLSYFVNWYQKHISGGEKGQAQSFFDRPFEASVCKVLTMLVMIFEMKKRGDNLQKHYRQAFDYWTRLVPNRPRYVVLCSVRLG